MRLIFFIAAVALALPAVPLAKGTLKALLTGPGIDEPFRLGGHGPLPALTEHSGLFRHRRASRPAPDLGPPYRILWSFGPGRAVRQDLYPYARPAPVTYLPVGPQLYGHPLQAGWFVGGPGSPHSP